MQKRIKPIMKDIQKKVMDSSDASADSKRQVVIQDGRPATGNHDPASQMNGCVNHAHEVDLDQYYLDTKPNCDRARKLVLHLDIRNTVLVADSVTNVCVEQALNSFLTGVTWGNVGESDGLWRWHSDVPSLTPPAPGTITYYKYLERRLVNTPEDRRKLRLKTGDFTQKDIGEIFYPYFKKHLDLLRWENRGDVETLKRLTMKGKDDKLYHYILPSFFKLLYHLHKADRDFAIVFRTYGLDAANVLLGTEHALNGSHPQFQDAFDMAVNRVPGCVLREADDRISMEIKTCNIGTDSPKTSTYKNEREIYKMLSKTKGITAYKDDFLHWQKNGYHFSAGKPLWVDLSDSSVQHIIFDDNMRAYEDDNIVNLRMFTGNEEVRSLSKPEMTKFEDSCMVQADLMESIENIDYFVNKLETCENNYTKLLKRYCPAGH